MIGDSNWGKCPLRYLSWVDDGRVRGGLGYICGKNDAACDPDYCLGPDEDMKGDENEEKME